jgi:hypothetical protein
MRLRLLAMLRRRGAVLPLGDADAAAALDRCAACQASALCDDYLAAADANAYRGFCPNSAYIEHLRHSCLRFK